MDDNTEISLDEIIQLMLNAETDEEYMLYKAYYYEHFINNKEVKHHGKSKKIKNVQ